MLTRHFFTVMCVLFAIVAAYTFVDLAADITVAAAQSSNPHSGDPGSIKNGKKLFRGMCSRCHGRNGQGSARFKGVGDLRKFNRGYSGFTLIVMNGLKKMPAWGGILSATDINDIGAYLETLAVEGSNWAAVGE